MNQGRFNVNLVCKIYQLNAEALSQREIASALGISKTTVNKYLKHYHYFSDNLECLLNINEFYKLFSKIEPRFADGALVRKISLAKYFPKKHKSEAFDLIRQGYSISFCYKKYLSEFPEKIHFKFDYYRMEMQRFSKEKLSKNIQVLKIFSKEDVLYLANRIGVNFKQVIFNIINRPYELSKNLNDAMKLISFISGNLSMYKVIENVAKDLTNTQYALSELWKVAICFKNINVFNQCKEWDSGFFERKQVVIDNYLQSKLNEYGLI